MNTQPPAETPEAAPLDLLDYLRQNWAKQLGNLPPGDPRGETEAVSHFIAVARQQLRTNLPVGVDYLSSIMSLRLQDSTTVPIVFVPENEVSQMGNMGPSAMISSPKTTQSGLVPSRSWAVTGK